MYEKIESAAKTVRAQLKRLTNALGALSPGNATARGLKAKAWLLSEHPILISTRAEIDDERRDVFEFDAAGLLGMQTSIDALVADCDRFLANWHGDSAFHARTVLSTIVPAFLDLVEAWRPSME